MSGSKSYTWEFHLTNTQQLDAYSWCNIGIKAMIMSICDAYHYSVIFCFPGSAIPCWFPYQCHGHSVVMNTCDPYWWGTEWLVGFALCAVLEHDGMDDTTTEKRTKLRYTIRFESNRQTHFLPDENGCFFYIEVRKRSFIHDHTFIWKYKLNFIKKVIHDCNFTIEIKATDYFLRETWKPNSQSTVKVKECGICPLFYLG
ncbi:unnamed protein product [Trifolium pratense]|uniref:Uncharacterized protein n=1 Tax=Trifolium pratense TaxID=57577 RepID=A0ACB0L191_TRIPR|nr:unnamed protein product [Trifolium pratense]